MQLGNELKNQFQLRFEFGIFEGYNNPGPASFKIYLNDILIEDNFIVDSIISATSIEFTDFETYIILDENEKSLELKVEPNGPFNGICLMDHATVIYWRKFEKSTHPYRFEHRISITNGTTDYFGKPEQFKYPTPLTPGKTYTYDLYKGIEPILPLSKVMDGTTKTIQILR